MIRKRRYELPLFLLLKFEQIRCKVLVAVFRVVHRCITSKELEMLILIKKVGSFFLGLAGLSLGGGIFANWQKGEFGIGGLIAGLCLGALFMYMGFSGAFFTDWTKPK